MPSSAARSGIGLPFTTRPPAEVGSIRAETEIGIFSRQCLGTRRIPDLETLRREAGAWNRRMNRDRIKINWKFNRKAARRKSGYKRNSSKRSKTQGRRSGLLFFYFRDCTCLLDSQPERPRMCPSVMTTFVQPPWVSAISARVPLRTVNNKPD